MAMMGIEKIMMGTKKSESKPNMVDPPALGDRGGPASPGPRVTRFDGPRAEAGFTVP
jgi:hypothetical protein